MPAPSLAELTIADEPAAWARLGFAVDADGCWLGGVRVHLAGPAAGRGLAGWALRDLAAAPAAAGRGGADDELAAGDIDGLPTRRAGPPPAAAAPSAAAPHPNGVAGLDHVVAIAPDLERTVAAVEAAGIALRRIREQPTPAGAPRQAFFRLGEPGAGPVLEVVQEPEEAAARGGPDRPAFFWGLALLVPDLAASAAFLGDRLGEPRDAVQPGRRIATLRRAAGLSLPLALITPPLSRPVRSAGSGSR